MAINNGAPKPPVDAPPKSPRSNPLNKMSERRITCPMHQHVGQDFWTISQYHHDLAPATLPWPLKKSPRASLIALVLWRSLEWYPVALPNSRTANSAHEMFTYFCRRIPCLQRGHPWSIFFWTSFFCGTGIHPTTMNNHVAQFEKNGVEKLRLHPKCPLHTNPASTSIETMGDFSMAIQCTLP